MGIGMGWGMGVRGVPSAEWSVWIFSGANRTLCVTLQSTSQQQARREKHADGSDAPQLGKRAAITRRARNEHNVTRECAEQG